MSKETKFELVKSTDAETEKKVKAHLSVIRIAFKGNRRARDLFFAYAAIAGAHANALMELLPHGEKEKFIEQQFGEEHRTLLNWRKFAEAIQPRLEKGNVSLLTAPSIGKRTLPAKAAAQIQEGVLAELDGKGMMEFMRASKALRDAEAAGGDRGGDKSAPRAKTAEEQQAEANAMLDAYKDQINAMVGDVENFKRASASSLAALETVRIELGKHIAAMREERKEKK